MKNILAISILSLSINAFAQTHSWPPGGTSPSPVTTNMHLPSNRYVPSSKRYNLVWGDQYYGQSTGRVKFIATNYVATQKIYKTDNALYRAYNSNFIVLIYHLANGINPKQNDDCPNPHTLTNSDGSGYIGVVAPASTTQLVSEWNNYFTPWLASAGITLGSTRYEQMFQHFIIDTTNSEYANISNRVWHKDPQWTMNIENTDWQKYMADIVLNWMAGNQNEGCFFDVSVETQTSLFHPKTTDPSPYNLKWYLWPHGPAGHTVNTLNNFAAYMNNAYREYYQYIYSKLHTAAVDYLILPNVDQMATSWYDPTWLDGNFNGETIDGAMMENFGGYTNVGDMYLTLSRAIKHITGRGKILIAQFNNNSQAERYRRAAMYMLVKNENSFLNIITSKNPEWYPEYEICLGDVSATPPFIDNLRVGGSGSASLWKRDYQYGMVLCNTSSSSMNYSLAGTGWNQVNTTGGGIVSSSGEPADQSVTFVPVTGSISVASGQCVILTNNTTVAVKSITERHNEITVYPNPNHGIFSVIVRDPFLKAEIEVYNMLGDKIITSKMVGDKTQIDLSKQTKGIYFVQIVSDRKVVASKKLIVE